MVNKGDQKVVERHLQVTEQKKKLLTKNSISKQSTLEVKFSYVVVTAQASKEVRRAFEPCSTSDMAGAGVKQL